VTTGLAAGRSRIATSAFQRSAGVDPEPRRRPSCRRAFWWRTCLSPKFAGRPCGQTKYAQGLTSFGSLVPPHPETGANECQQRLRYPMGHIRIMQGSASIWQVQGGPESTRSSWYFQHDADRRQTCLVAPSGRSFLGRGALRQTQDSPLYRFDAGKIEPIRSELGLRRGAIANPLLTHPWRSY